MSGSTPQAGRTSRRSTAWASVWRARWVVVAAALAAGAGGYAVSQGQPEEFVATGQVVLSANRDFAPVGASNFVDSSRYVATQVSIMTAEPVLDAAAAGLEGTTTGELAMAVEASAAGEGDVIVVRVTGPDRQVAAARANAVIEAYQEHVTERVAAAADAAFAATADPLVRDQIRTSQAVYGDGVAVVEPAVPPGEPAAPRPWRDALLLAAAAAVLGALLSLVRRPGRAQDGASVAEVVGAPVLGTVPVPRPGRSDRGVQDPADHALALVALDFVVGRSGGPVLVAGTGPGDGAASAVAGLAAAAAAQGRRVLLVDGVPGARPLSLQLGITSPPPALDSAAGAEDGDSLTGPLEVPGASERIQLAVLGGAVDIGLADEDTVRHALGKFVAAFDLVLVQVGPVTESPTALAMLRHAGAVVVVVAENGDVEQLTAVRERVEATGRHPDAALLTSPQRRGRRSAPGPAQPLREPVRSPSAPAVATRPAVTPDGVRGG
ncbi:hypothetical protein [Blastococcus tunisiensis]|uniref:Capsular polysaccharide biosynthesis protein n=1 Tax=Blastococcus tunisiensis TaxID=1798228 RepID=A0A1I1XA36_9ACTN|nr:hypothetical protein [Blastococcus sp. DSM 46838]SFE04255.1 Capsular polysaccharide biosynthesis protein [Blastococcus sp. DSM 46838]